MAGQFGYVGPYMRMNGRSSLFKALSLVLVVSMTAPAFAQTPAATKTGDAKKPAAGAAAAPKPDINEAKKRYAAGEKKFKAGDYPGALDDFSAADAIKSTPQSARYIGLSDDKLGKFPDAVAAYDRF